MSETSDEDHRQIWQRARQVAAYLPATLAMGILRSGMPPIARPRWFEAAVLFADISGFTPMSEELASDGPRGAEELSRVLLELFKAMIDVIHRCGGSVSHFYGDAMVIYFPELEGEAGRNALACAGEMQHLMSTRFARAVTRRPPGKEPVFPMTMKIGGGYGRCLDMVVGSPATSLEYVLAGEAVEQATAAENQATAGDIIASQALLAQAGRATAAEFAPFTGRLPLPSPRPILDLAACSEADCYRLIAAATPFVPSVHYERIIAGDDGTLADHRPAANLFVEFGGLDFDAPEVGQRLQEYYEWALDVIARYGRQNGRVNRITTGDKGNQLHIIFGAPVAPDAPEQALRCALALQREKPSFVTHQKIGLSVGKVFSSPMGSDDRHEFTIVGDIVNLSSRLTGVCPDGDVLVDGGTAQRVQGEIELELLPPVKLKGKAEPVAIFRVASERSGRRQLRAFLARRQRPLVGREEPLQRLRDCMDDALAGQGRLVALAGPIGVGKTQLLTAAVGHWLDAGGAGFVGVCYPHTAEVPFGPWQNIWREFFGLAPGMSPAEQATAVVEQTRRLLPEVGDDVGLWAEVLGLPVPQTEIIAALAAPVRRSRFFSLVRRLGQAVVRQQPVSLILEDVHWADEPSLELIQTLADLAADQSLCIVLTMHDDDEVDLAALAQPFAVTIYLTDYSPEEAALYARERLGVRRLPPELESALDLRSTNGHNRRINPLFLDEKIKAMLAARAIELVGYGSGRALVQVDEARLGRMVLPDTVHGLMLARMDRLPPASRDLLQVAAVIGEQFELAMLQSMASHLDREAVIARLQGLETAEITQQIVVDPSPVYLFQHAMAREVVYESLPYVRRQALHARAAEYLEQRHADNLRPLYPALAYHYGRTELHDKGLRYALAAANDAVLISANREAIELFNIADHHLRFLAPEAHWETAVDLRLARSGALRLLGNFQQAMHDVDRALEQAIQHGDPVRTAQAYTRKADYQYRQAYFNDALALAMKVIDEFAGQIPPQELAIAHQWAAMAASELFDRDLALAHLRQAEQICLQTNNNQMLARVLNAMAFNYFVQDELELALAAMQRGIALSRDYDTAPNVVSALNNIALIQLKLGRPEAALATVDEAVRLAQETSRNLFARDLANKGGILAYLGRYDEAWSHFEEATELLSAMGDDYGLIEAYLLWGLEIDCVRGDWRAARRHFLLVEDLIEQQPASYPEEQVRLWLGLGQIALAEGSAQQAQSVLDRACRQLEARGLSWWYPPVAYGLGQAARAEGDEAGARIWFEQARERAEECGNLDLLPRIWLALADGTTGEERLGCLARCVETAVERGRFTDRLDCLLVAGAELAEATDDGLRRLGAQALQAAERLATERPLRQTG